MILSTIDAFSFRFIQYAVKGVSEICRLQKPTRIYQEKRFETIPDNNTDECCPGDRDDNLWVTIDGYKPPETQTEWEQTCFLSESFLGYYKWPNKIVYPQNKRERYIQNTMPEQVAIIYDRFIDRDFIKQMTEFMIVDDVEKDAAFDKARFDMFKVKNIECKTRNALPDLII